MNSTEVIAVTEDQVAPSVTLNWIRSYMGPLGMLGMLCNILIIITVLRLESASKSTSGLAMQLLALWDSLAVLGDAGFEMILKSLFSFDLFSVDPSGFLCKALSSFDWLGNHTANWHVVLVCLDRYLLIAHPVFARNRWKQIHVGLFSAIATMFTWFSQWPFLYFFKMENGVCVLNSGVVSARLFSMYLNIQIYVMYFAIPGFLILSMSAAFFFKMRNFRSKMATRSNTGLSAERVRVESAYERMIISLICSYIILGTGSAVGISLGIEKGYLWAYNMGDGFLILQSSSNLLFYTMSGPVFREALWKTIKCTK